MLQTLIKIWTSLSEMVGGSALGKASIVTTAFLTSFFVPILPIILLCFFVTLVDMYYGIKVAHRNKVKPQSRHMWTGTITKIRDTFIILILGHAVEIYLLNRITDIPVLVCSSAIIVTLTEMWSILENMNTLNPHGPWRVLRKFLKKKGSNYLNIDLEQIEKELEDEINKSNNKGGTGSV